MKEEYFDDFKNYDGINDVRRNDNNEKMYNSDFSLFELCSLHRHHNTSRCILVPT